MKTKQKKVKAYGIVDQDGYPVMDALYDNEPLPTIMIRESELKRHARLLSYRQDTPHSVVPVEITYTPASRTSGKKTIHE